MQLHRRRASTSNAIGTLCVAATSLSLQRRPSKMRRQTITAKTMTSASRAERSRQPPAQGRSRWPTLTTTLATVMLLRTP